jgi:hypothetical protein
MSEAHNARNDVTGALFRGFANLSSTLIGYQALAPEVRTIEALNRHSGAVTRFESMTGLSRTPNSRLCQPQLSTGHEIGAMVRR